MFISDLGGMNTIFESNIIIPWWKLLCNENFFPWKFDDWSVGQSQGDVGKEKACFAIFMNV